MTDLILNIDDDLQFEAAGDFTTGDSLLQNQTRIIMDGKNDWKQFPDMGVGAELYLDDENPDALFREIREQMRMDGMRVKTLRINQQGQIELDAE